MSDGLCLGGESFEKQHWICSLEDELGCLIWVSLRDETCYVGLFKTFDQYGNIVLTDAVKKIVIASKGIFSDIYCGHVVIRGESVAYFSQLDAAAYLSVFRYDSKLEPKVFRQMLNSASRRSENTAADSKTTLKFVAIAEALLMLKQEQEANPDAQTPNLEMLLHE